MKFRDLQFWYIDKHKLRMVHHQGIDDVITLLSACAPDRVSVICLMQHSIFVFTHLVLTIRQKYMFTYRNNSLQNSEIKCKYSLFSFHSSLHWHQFLAHKSSRKYVWTHWKGKLESTVSQVNIQFLMT